MWPLQPIGQSVVEWILVVAHTADAPGAHVHNYIMMPHGIITSQHALGAKSPTYASGFDLFIPGYLLYPFSVWNKYNSFKRFQMFAAQIELQMAIVSALLEFTEEFCEDKITFVNL